MKQSGKMGNPNLSWEELIILARNYKKIVVSGCQRSGTTVIAKSLSKELNYIYYDERTFNNDDIKKFEEFLTRPISIVFQAPGILEHLPKYQHKCLIVIVERDVNDVVKSMKRIKWLNNFGIMEYRKFKPNEYPSSPEDIYHTKLEFCDTFENVRLNYNELKKTKYYIEDRRNFNIKQTE